MKKRNLQNEGLDKIGRTLFEAAKLPGEDIEKIVASPQLFNSVKAKIKAEESKRDTVSLGSRGVFPVWNRLRIGFASGVLVVTLAGVIFLFVFAKQKQTPLIAEQVVAPDIRPSTAPFEKLPIPQAPENSGEFEKTQKSIRKKQAFVTQTVFKSAKTHLAKSLPKMTFAKSRLPHETDADGKFYPLMFSPIPDEMRENIRVIRMDMTRSSLLALGVNIAPENEDVTIKADLVVGIDGIPQAIRFVKPN